MRFQFCGNISCPEWFIAQITVLTKITAVKMKLIFTQLINFYLEGTDISAKTVKLLNGTGLDIYEMNAVAATLNFILQNSVMFQVSDSILNKELVDLGLPKENVESITKTYKSNRQKLIEYSQQRGIKLSSELELNYSIHQLNGSSQFGKEFRENNRKGVKFSEVELQYRNRNQQKQKMNMVICEDHLDELIYQLEDALAIMKKLQNKSK